MEAECVSGPAHHPAMSGLPSQLRAWRSCLGRSVLLLHNARSCSGAILVSSSKKLSPEGRNIRTLAFVPEETR